MSDHKNNSNIWYTLFTKIFTLPEHPPLDAKHSLVYTFDSSMKYYPLQDETTIPLYTQGIYFIAYIVIWSIIIWQGCNTCTVPYMIGFIVGIIIIILESFLYSMITNIQLLRTSNKPMAPYISNLPQVDNIKIGEAVGNINKRISFYTDGGHGDYKILFNNKLLPRSDHEGYILPVPTFLDKSSSGEIQSMNLDSYLKGKVYTGATNDSDVVKYNTGMQNNIEFYTTRITKLSKSAYYISMIIITWAMYVTNSKWGSTRQLYWNLLTFMIAIIAGAMVLTGGSIISYNSNIYLKKRLIILAISLGITSILII